VRAQEFKAGPLEIRNPWTRATPKGARVAGGYLTIVNRGSAADRLIGGSAPIAGKVEIHEMKIEHGVMRMRPLSAGLEIKPGQTVELKPGSYHLMFMDLRQPLEQGGTFKATLMFERAGAVEVEYRIEAIGASRPSDGGGHGH